MPNLKSKIRILPEYLIDQIKAGEVIESPSSLLKEIIENSIDANSTNINIHICDNGLELIKLEDNGSGMSYEDLSYAFCRHATSKIESFEDLYHLRSFGFRGEALASMASISRLTCSSFNGKTGGKIFFSDGHQTDLQEFSSDTPGTSIFIKDLFYNTPARMNFIKSKSAEKRAIERIINSYILSNPQIHFSIKWDNEDKKIFHSPKQYILSQRIKDLFYNLKSHEDLIEFSQEYEGHQIRGFVTHQGTRSTKKRFHFLFANNRPFNEKSFHHAIVQIMKRVWEEGTVGSYVIFLDVPTKLIDVNIHPSKTRIKFAKSAEVFSLITSSLKEAILKSSLKSPVIQSDQKLPQIENTFKIPSTQQDLTYKEDRYQSLSFNQTTLKIHPIQNQFILVSEVDKNLLVKCNIFFKEYIRQFNHPISEEETTPLLITFPYRTTSPLSEQTINLLRKHGVLLDNIEPHLYLLRAIPPFLEKLPYKIIIENIIHIESKTLWDNLPDTFPFQQSCLQLFHSTSFNELKSYKGVIELNDNRLEELFSHDS